METIKVLDLFAGCGGLSLGFDLVRNERDERVYEVVKAVEIARDACDTLRNYFKREYGRDDIVLEGDLTRAATRRQIVKACRGKVSIIVGGPPCQSFSTLGPRSGYGLRDKKFKRDRRDRLYKEYLKIVRAIKPSFIIFENVKGIISKRSRSRRYIDIIASDFKKLGYSFKSANPEMKTDYLILNAADYGVPQIRERVFLIGNNLGMLNPFPRRTHGNPRKAGQIEGLLPWTTLRDAIGDLPRLKARFTRTGIPKHRVKVVEKLNRRRFCGAASLPFDEARYLKHFRSRGVSGHQLLQFVRQGANGQLLYHEARAQKADDIKLFAGMRQGCTAEQLFRSKAKNAKELLSLIKYRMQADDGEFTFGDKYRKQQWNSPSTTLFAHLAKDGNRFIHPDRTQARTFTVREAARIQTFPDWYEFYSTSRGGKFRQIGNAVPPLLAYAIARELAGAFPPPRRTVQPEVIPEVVGVK